MQTFWYAPEAAASAIAAPVPASDSEEDIPIPAAVRAELDDLGAASG